MTHDDFISCMVQFGFYPNGVAKKWLLHPRFPGVFFEYDPADYEQSIRNVLDKATRISGVKMEPVIC